MRIVLFGPPGAGKGSQARLLVERRSLTHISTGNIIRAAMKAETSAGREARTYVEAGELVPGRLVQRMAEDAIAAVDYKAFVLDGYPRTIEQAEWLTAFLESHRTPLHAVISLHVPDDRIVDRLSKRRVHRETGENYHLEMKPPPEGVDPAMIMQRPDDQPDAIRNRLKVYRRETQPVARYYENRGQLVAVDGTGTFEEVHERVVEVLDAGVE